MTQNPALSLFGVCSTSTLQCREHCNFTASLYTTAINGVSLGEKKEDKEYCMMIIAEYCSLF